MNRRRFLAALAALPFVAKTIEHERAFVDHFAARGITLRKVQGPLEFSSPELERRFTRELLEQANDRVWNDRGRSVTFAYSERALAKMRLGDLG